MSSKLPNYLRTYRKRAGFSEDEVSFLLGRTNANNVSRHEGSSRQPDLKAALTYEAVFGVPSRELFAGVYEKVEEETARRAKVLARQLAATKHDPVSAQKLAALQDIIDPAVPKCDATKQQPWDEGAACHGDCTHQ